jgi:hypothetical protein
VVLRQEQGRLVAMVTYGPQATSAAVLLDANGAPRIRTDLGPLRFHTGTAAETATALADGQEIGWLYRPGSGYPTVAAARSLAPVFIGVPLADLADVAGAQVHLGQYCSLRSADGSRQTALAVYASGEVVLRTEPE